MDGRSKGRSPGRACARALACVLLAWSGLGRADVTPAPLPDADTPRTLHVIADDNYPPYLFRDVDGQVQGYLVDYWSLWSRRTGVKVQLEAANWAQAQRRFLAGEGDVIDEIFRTDPRELLYSFSSSYANLPANIYYHASIAGVGNVATLKGFRVGVMAGDACIDELNQRGIRTLIRYPSYTDLINAAVRREFEVFCLDESPAQFYFSRLGVQHHFRKGFTLYTGQFHRAVRKGDFATLDLVERGMRAISDDEDAALREKWFGTPVDVDSYVRYAGRILLVVALAGLILLVWIVSLRSTVRKRTGDLRQALDGLREANRAERESRQNLKAALEAIPDLLFEIDADGKYLSAFVSNKTLLASPQESLLGRKVQDVLPADAAATTMAAIRSALQSGTDYGRTIELDLPTGRRWFELSVARKDGAADGPATAMVLSRDVTQRVETERELEAMRATSLMAERDRVFRMLFESSPVPMMHLRGNVVESLNPQFTRLFGWDTKKLRTFDDWWSLAYPDPTYREERRRNWQASLDAALAGHPIVPRDVDVTCADGKVRRILIDAQVVGTTVIASLVDVTQLHQAEAALRAAKQAAELASLAKSRFLANMSHEIRTPLNGIIGMAHLMRESGLGHEQAERLDKLEAAADHLLQILSAILDLSKIEAGKFVLEERPVCLDSVVSNAIAMVEQKAHAKGLRVVSDIQRLPVELVGDATRLQQALLNYANNAVKFTERGSIIFRVRTVHEDASEVLCRFEVTDTGIGIEADTLARLFTSFEQADVSTTRRFGGTGLGLAITKGLAELMGGEAGAESVPDSGSTFWFTAKLRKAPRSSHSREGSDRTAPESPATVLRSRHAGARVLVAEDNEINAEVATALLHRVGLAVDLAVDGAEAVRMGTTGKYALILMDVQMPTMDGLEATRRILAALKDPPPVIAMTANAFAEDREVCLAAGMSDFIGKPMEPRDLYATVLSWLDARAAAPMH